MPSFNKVMMMGHLTREPDLREIQNGTPLCKCGIAVNRKYKDKEEVCFIDLTIWGESAERFADWFGKGAAVFIEGRLQFDQWQDEDGGKRSKHSIVVERFQGVGGRPVKLDPLQPSLPPSPPPSAPPTPPPALLDEEHGDIAEDSIPF